MEKLPKAFLSALDNLCDENQLYSWNIHSKGNVINVNIRFLQHGQCTSTPNSTNYPGIRRKSPGQLKRDINRSKDFSMFRSDIPKLNTENSDHFDSNFSFLKVSQPFYTHEQSHNEHSSMTGHDHGNVGHERDTTCTEANVNNQQSDGLQDFDENLRNSEHDFDVYHSDSASSGKESDHSDEQVDAFINPSDYFCKVVIDLRPSVEYATYRGLTPSGDIVSFESENKNHEKNLYILKPKINNNYYETKAIICKLHDQKHLKHQSKGVQNRCVKYEQYLADHPNVT